MADAGPKLPVPNPPNPVAPASVPAARVSKSTTQMSPREQGRSLRGGGSHCVPAEELPLTAGPCVGKCPGFRAPCELAMSGQRGLVPYTPICYCFRLRLIFWGVTGLERWVGKASVHQKEVCTCVMR